MKAPEIGQVTVKRGQFPGVTRLRDREFVGQVVARVAQNGGEITDDVLVEAADAAFYDANLDPAAARKAQLARAKKKLKLSTIGGAILEFYEATTGFSLADAAKLHVSHIKGLKHKITRLNPDTNKVETITLRDKPNYQALKDFQALVIPKEAKQVNVDSRTLVARMTVPDSYNQPEIDPLPIGTEKTQAPDA